MLPKVAVPKLLKLPVRKRRDASGKRQRSSPVEIQLLRRSIRRMEAASPKIVLERLKEEWVEVADASVYRRKGVLKSAGRRMGGEMSARFNAVKACSHSVVHM